MIKKLTTLIVLIGISLSNFAQDDTPKQRNWTLNGYVKYMQTISFQEVDKDWVTDNVLHNRLNFNWNINNNFTFNAQMRNRVFYGETVTDFPQYPEIVNQETGYFDLSFIVFEGKSVFMQSTFDRFYLDYNIKNVQITIGRQRINWGQTFVWNPNDLFNSYNFFDFDYEEKPGSDAVRLQFYPSYSSKLDLVVKVDNNSKVTAAGLYRFNQWSTDIQVLTGYYAETDYVLGAGFSGSLFKGGLRGEVSYFHPKDNFSDTTGTFVMSLGYDYTFKNSLMIQFEGLYNGYGEKSGEFNMLDFYFMQLTPQNLSLTEFSFVGQVTYPFTPLFNGTFSAMYSPNDKSVYLGPSLNYSIKDNFEVSFFTQYFTSETPADEGGKGVFLYWRVKWSF
ncbi:MAG: hypothetical protein DRJ10_21085 [Bacteroidetes bacterium]|nr:MAG: hypothetical protein DRJ10_21085 [Bacteroidota bacterium]